MVVQTADVSGIVYLGPILAFLIVALVTFAVLRKAKILGGFVYVDAFAALIVGLIFVSVQGVYELVLGVIPWFAVLLIGLFLILVLMGFIGKVDMIGVGVGWAFIVLMVAVFLIVGFNIFAGNIVPYLPGPFFGIGGDPQMLWALDWLYSPAIAGGILLLVFGGAVSWMLIKFG